MLISTLGEVEQRASGAGPPLDVAEAAVKLFGDPLRAHIVRLLTREQMCTCHLVRDTGARQSTISHHLRILREAGFVAAEPRGRYTYYRLRPEALAGLTAGIAELTVQAHRAQAVRRPCS
ncbi:helix-turn-helix transcriptional regulator [Mycobacterium sp.]|uniref:ArsR/SmtB family transcription factor n=1 Tax=Mycobacterium sp. TaxID=1785 RepID=UPI0012713F0E|nr:metalloregulator ArsR/SmtB family transcription factor [Mycobacterium sp.]KAA8960176.1 MAG: helix-turn-helix transcriptional regulator [Mycobacterium sp.]